MRTCWIWASVWAMTSVLSARADVTLFDGSLNTTPNQQGWLYLTQPTNGSSAVQTASGGVTRLNTTGAQADHAGYFSSFHPLMPTLNAATGYTIWLDARIGLESHASNDRAGFSMIVLGSDHRGVELGFWQDQVWAQLDSPVLFTHGESALINTTSAIRRYGLSVLGNTYTLFVGGQGILTGSLRDYSSFGAPYTASNFLFIGDDTSSAAADVEIGRVAVSLSAIPEPASYLLIGLGLTLGWTLRAWRFR